MGKTSILNRYTKNIFNEKTKPTVGCDLFQKNVKLPSKKKIRLTIWDTAGQERFRGLSSAFYKNTKCVILVFDISHKRTFDNLERWLDEARTFACNMALIIVIGNKSDLEIERKVNRELALKFTERNKIFYSETSALENNDGNIQSVFEFVADWIDKNKEEWKKTNGQGKDFYLNNIDLSKKKKEKDLCEC